MPKTKLYEPTRLLCSAIRKFNDDPLLGALVMQTTEGNTVVAINRITAEQLQSELSQFLSNSV